MGGVCSCSKGVKRSASVAPEEAGPVAPQQEDRAPAASAPGPQLNRTRTHKAARRGSVSAEAFTLSAVQGKKSMVPKTEATRKRLSDLIKSTLLFNELDEDQESAVVDALFERKVEAGEAVIREGEVGDNFYLIESGRFQVSKKGETKFTYDGKGSFGELALMYNCPRAATVTAETAGILWGMDRASFKAVIVTSMVERRQRFEATLQSMDLFRHLSHQQLAAIADCVTVEQYEAGQLILKENDELETNDKFYMIESGTVECLRTFEGRKLLTKALGAGNVFGEVALLTKAPRQADCVAATKVKCLSMSRDAFERLMGPVEKSLARHIAEYDQFNADLVLEGSRRATNRAATPRSPANYHSSDISAHGQNVPSPAVASHGSAIASAATSRAASHQHEVPAASKASECAGSEGSAAAVGSHGKGAGGADASPVRSCHASHEVGDGVSTLAEEGSPVHRSRAGTPSPGSPTKLATQIREWERRFSSGQVAAEASSGGFASPKGHVGSATSAAAAAGSAVEAAPAAALASRSGGSRLSSSTEGGESAADLSTVPAEEEEADAPASSLEPIVEDPSNEGASRRGTTLRY